MEKLDVSCRIVFYFTTIGFLIINNHCPGEYDLQKDDNQQDKPIYCPPLGKDAVFHLAPSFFSWWSSNCRKELYASSVTGENPVKEGLMDFNTFTPFGVFFSFSMAIRSWLTVVSARVVRVTKRGSAMAGVAASIFKPYDQNELLKRIRQLLDSRKI